MKQWQKAEATQKDAIVSTFVGGREHEVSHAFSIMRKHSPHYVFKPYSNANRI